MDTIKTLKRHRGTNGRPVPGLWVGDGVRMEKDDQGWKTGVSLARIGLTAYWEYKTTGAFMVIGHFPTREVACRAADALKAGTHVYRGPTTDSLGPFPGMICAWESVRVEIGIDPSVTGEPRRIQNPPYRELYYRTGGTMNFQWRKVYELFDEAGAQEAAEQIRRMGYHTVIVDHGAPAPTAYEPEAADVA